eukprot:2922390-Prymnesium_polylepis.1
MSVGVGGRSVGLRRPNKFAALCAAERGSVGRLYPGRDRPRTEGRVGRSKTQIKKSTSHPRAEIS